MAGILTITFVTTTGTASGFTKPTPAIQDGCQELQDHVRTIPNNTNSPEYSVVTLSLNYALIMVLIFGLFCVTLAHGFNWIRMHVYDDKVKHLDRG